MKKILLSSDSFKGSLSSSEICDLFARFMKQIRFEGEYSYFPIADGGEGTLEAFSSIIKGKMNAVQTIDANALPIEVSYFLYGETAVIEVASVVGLPHTKIKNPSLTTTYGLGALILNAIQQGAKKVLIGLGGSSTNDGGIGLLDALGAKFYDQEGKLFHPFGGKDLNRISKADLSAAIKVASQVEIIGLCDVRNPLFGPEGASFVYGPQKGGDPAMIRELDIGMQHYAHVLNKENISILPGAGASGGLGFALLCLNGRLRSGIETILSETGFYDALDRDTLVISGEGRLDDQSFNGKAIEGIAKAVAKAGASLKLIVGIVDPKMDLSSLQLDCLKGIYSLSSFAADSKDSVEHAKAYYLLALQKALQEEGLC